MNKSIEKNYGLELLKVLCMVSVIAFHFSDHGNVVLSCNQPVTTNWTILAICRIFGGICNCVFVLTSGYFLCEKSFKARRIIQLWLEVWFYSVVLGLICFMIGTEAFSIKSVIKMLFPVCFNEYWYFSSYIVLYLLFPFINRMLSSINKRQHEALIVIGLILFSILPTFVKATWLQGTNYIAIFIVLYCVGAYLRKYNISINKKMGGWYIAGLVLLEILSIFFMRVVYNNIQMDVLDYFVWGMDRILPIAISVILIIMFRDVKPKKERLINFFSASLFGVYLFHIGRLNVLIFKIIFDNSKYYDSPWMIVQLIIAVITIFIVGILVDKIRILVFEKQVLKIIDKPIKRIDTRIKKMF